MPSILAEILADKRAEVERAGVERPLESLKSMPGYALPRRNFYGAVSVPRRGGPNLIAELKRASPSAGLICPDFDPARLARQYADGQAQALSVLTDEKYFGGRLELVEQVKTAVGLPVLRKDFLLDPYQLHESRAFGADAVLLIVEAVGASRLPELVALARELELCVLVEVHKRETLLEFLLTFDAEGRSGLLVGINNRDLNTQIVDLATTERLAELVPPGMPIVAESGIKTRQDVNRMHTAGARALLIGEALLRSGEPRVTIRRLFG